MIIPLYIHIPVFLLIYFVADALHDTWLQKEKGYSVKAQKAKDANYRQLCRGIALRFSRMWHALDAGIKAFVVINLAYAFYGFEWVVLYWGLFAGFLRWITHDLSWNIFNGMNWNYRGTVAFLDRLRISDTVYFLLKLTGLAVSIYLLITNLTF